MIKGYLSGCSRAAHSTRARDATVLLAQPRKPITSRRAISPLWSAAQILRQQVRALCFTAEGVATGDVNLAQKIALETFESKVLAIANRSGGTTWHEIESQIEQPAEEPRSLLQFSRAAALATAIA
jgi:hypothetical protein